MSPSIRRKWKVKMDNTQFFNRKLQRVGWGLLAILWGGTILFDFVPFGVGLIGTGLILFGVNIVRSINHVSTENDNAIFGSLALAWGGLELARPWLHRLFPSADLDWAIFAMLLIGLGLILLARAFLHSNLSLRHMRSKDYGS
jgi:hypothetical protein